MACVHGRLEADPVDGGVAHQGLILGAHAQRAPGRRGRPRRAAVGRGLVLVPRHARSAGVGRAGRGGQHRCDGAPRSVPARDGGRGRRDVVQPHRGLRPRRAVPDGVDRPELDVGAALGRHGEQCAVLHARPGRAGVHRRAVLISRKARLAVDRTGGGHGLGRACSASPRARRRGRVSSGRSRRPWPCSQHRSRPAPTPTRCRRCRPHAPARTSARARSPRPTHRPPQGSTPTRQARCGARSGRRRRPDRSSRSR